METAIGIMVGGGITIAASWFFYVQAAKELRTETNRVRKQVDMVLTSLSNAGIADLHYNEAGEIDGINVTVRPPTIEGGGEVYPPTIDKPPPPDEESS